MCLLMKRLRCCTWPAASSHMAECSSHDPRKPALSGERRVTRRLAQSLSCAPCSETRATCGQRCCCCGTPRRCQVRMPQAGRRCRAHVQQCRYTIVRQYVAASAQQCVHPGTLVSVSTLWQYTGGCLLLQVPPRGQRRRRLHTAPLRRAWRRCLPGPSLMAAQRRTARPRLLW